VALNLKFTPESGERILDDFVGYVEGYFDDMNGARDGGMEVQFIIEDHDTLAEAARHPERHPELLVRVSGYTAYFKDLNPQMQKEIIDRTEYSLSHGRMIPYPPFPLPKGNPRSSRGGDGGRSRDEHHATNDDVNKKGDDA
jgi:formate C-acetyltransferase